MKKVINSLTKKDGNKLGKRKKERKWLELEFKSKMNPLDIKAFAKDIIESTGERRERLYLPSFAGPVSEMDGNSLNPFYSYVSPQRNIMFSHPNIEKGTLIKRVNVDELDDELSVTADWIPDEVSMDKRLYLPSFAGPVSEILSMDHGIKSGDMACIGVVQHTDDMFKSNIMQTVMMHAKENGAHVATMCLEIDMEEHMRRMNKLCNPKIPVDDDFKWEYKPILLDEADMELYLEKKRDKNARLEAIFMKARTSGKSISLTTPIVKVDVIK